MNHLLRGVAPLTEAAWSAIDAEAAGRATPFLAARRLVDFAGPHGWEHSAVNSGRTRPLSDAPCEGVRAALRAVLPLVELRADFGLSRRELAALDRGAGQVDLGPLDQAVRLMALSENQAVFHGFAGGGVVGITEASAHPPIALDGDFDHYPRFVAQAVEVLMNAGVGGPYGVALSPSEYTGVVQTTEHGGYPVFEHVGHILQGPIVWSPGVAGAVVVSLRGGDLRFESGQDLSIGYDSHTAESVRLYLEESFAFQVDEPEAAVALTHS